MKLIHSIVAYCIICNCAFAEVSVVTDVSKNAGVITARVLNKTPVYQDIAKAGTKNVCVRTGIPVHYMGYGKGQTKLFNEGPFNADVEYYCRKVDNPVMVKALIGYQITYEFRGTIMHDFLNYEPGEYVQVYSGK